MSTRRLFWIIFLTVVSSMMAAIAQSPSVEVSLPRNPETGERFTLTITVTNADGSITPPSAPELDGCTLLGGPGVSTSSYTSIINGRMQSSQSTAYSYTYRADKEGKVKVPSRETKVNGKTLATTPGQFAVLPASERRSSAGQGGGYGGMRQPQEYQPGSGSEFRVGSDELFIRMELSASSVYEQQAVECVTKLYSANGQIRSISAASVPSFDGCLIESLPTSTNIEWNREHFNGQNYYTAVISRSLLYPQRGGELSIGGGEYTVNVYREMIVHDFPFSRRVMDDKDVTVKPRPAKLRVMALPEPQPAGFSGAVGSFTADTRIVGSSFKTNEAATLIYTVSGTGNIKYLKEPEVDMPSEFELYDPHVENTAKVSGRNMTGTMTVEYTFVPQTVGQFHIGSAPFIYFDPSKKEYVTLTLPVYDINVEQGAKVSSSVDFGGKRDIESKNTDIHFIRPGASAPSQDTSFMVSRSWYWILYPVMLLAVGVFIIVYMRGQKSRSDVKARRLSKANKVARRRLSRAGRSLKDKNYERFYEEMLQAMQGYLGDKLQLPGSQLNRENVAAVLSGRGASQDTVASVIAILDDCEMARYTPQSSPERAGKVYEDAMSAIDQIENLKIK